MMEPWKRIEPTKVTKVGWRNITTKTFQMPDGEITTFDTLHADGQEFAAIIAVTKDKKIVVARQFRPGPELVMDELPGGFVDPGETPEVSATRELLEETGYSAGKVNYLGSIHKDTYMNAMWHILLATGCEKTAEPEHCYTEHIEIDLISIDTLIANAKTDKMSDHAAIVLAYDDLMKLKEA